MASGLEHSNGLTDSRWASQPVEVHGHINTPLSRSHTILIDLGNNASRRSERYRMYLLYSRESTIETPSHVEVSDSLFCTIPGPRSSQSLPRPSSSMPPHNAVQLPIPHKAVYYIDKLSTAVKACGHQATCSSSYQNFVPSALRSRRATTTLLHLPSCASAAGFQVGIHTGDG